MQSDGPQPLDFENRWSWGAVFAVESTSGRALSTFSQSDSERRANRTGFARESSARIETSELAAKLLVVYDYRGEDTEMRTPARRRVDAAGGPDISYVCIYTRGRGEEEKGVLAALGQFYPELGGTLQNRLLSHGARRS